MDFEKDKVDDIVKNAKAMLKIDTRAENYAGLEMESAIGARAIAENEFSNRHVVEAAEAYVSDLDDRSRSGSLEWEALSKSVDAARKPVLEDEARRREAHAMAARAAQQGMGR